MCTLIPVKAKNGKRGLGEAGLKTLGTSKEVLLANPMEASAHSWFLGGAGVGALDCQPGYNLPLIPGSGVFCYVIEPGPWVHKTHCQCVLNSASTRPPRTY